MKRRPLILVAGMFLALFVGWLTRSPDERIKYPISQSQPVSTLPSQAEQEAFWKAHLEPTVVQQLFAGKYAIPEINERYNFLFVSIEKRYGTKVVGSLVNHYHEVSQQIGAGSWVNKGVPTLEIYIPAQMDIYAQLQKEALLSSPADKLFEIQAICSTMHELEHLAWNPDGVDPLTKEGLIVIERQAWANTCRYELEPLVTKYQFSLPSGVAPIYQAWLRAGKDENNPAWEATIRKYYEPLRK